MTPAGATPPPGCLPRLVVGLLFLGRHALAAAVATASFAAIAVAAYLFLLFVAIVADKGLGSPLLVFLVPILGLVGGLGLSLLVAFPVSVAAEALLVRRWRCRARIHVPAVGVLFAALGWGVARASGPDVPPDAGLGAITAIGFLAAGLPYWITLRAAGGLADWLSRAPAAPRP